MVYTCNKEQCAHLVRERLGGLISPDQPRDAIIHLLIGSPSNKTVTGGVTMLISALYTKRCTRSVPFLKLIVMGIFLDLNMVFVSSISTRKSVDKV